jgi:DNA-directed RNA polymerase subunit RPC12/RpoP
MEIDKFPINGSETSNGLPNELIKVHAEIRCPSCTYRKRFKNEFHRDNIEMMVVSLKVFTWMVCNDCGELLKLDLEFEL